MTTAPGQDAARRGEAHARLDAYKAREFLGISQDRQVVDLMVDFADAAVAEARRAERQACAEFVWTYFAGNHLGRNVRDALLANRPPASAPEGEK